VSTLLDAVSTNTTGTTYSFITATKEHLIQIFSSGSMSASVEIQVSMDGLNWYSYVTKTAPELFTVVGAPYVRAKVASWVSGTISVVLQQQQL
jgi:hypothetical protein